MPMPTFHNLSIQWKLRWVSMLASGTTLLLICTAFVVDRANAPPQTSWQLTIVAKLKQKAAN